MRIRLIFVCFVLCIPFVSAHYLSANGGASLFFEHEPPQAGVNETIWVWITNANGEPVTQPDIVHERLVHSFIVGQDGEFFVHLHPEEFSDGFKRQDSGIYTLHYQFPAAGRYIFITDFTEKEVNYFTMIPFVVSGEDSLSENKRDESRVSEQAGYVVSLELPELISSGKKTAGSFYITKDGQDVTDLEIYLGEAYVLYVNENLSFVEHAYHAENDSQRYTGPRVPVEFTFPEDGIYFVFAQFQHEGKVITAKFRVQVGESFPVWMVPAAIALIVLLIIGARLLVRRQ